MPPRRSQERHPGSLPAGRHGLSRAFVVDDQRSRLLDATLQSAFALGYAPMSVEDVVSRAGVSRRTFYELFDNKLDVFLAAFDASATMLLGLVAHAYEAESSFERRVSSGLTAFLGGLSIAPESARVCIVESLAAGPVAIARRMAVMAEFARLIEDNARVLPGADVLPRALAETLVGGIYETAFVRICAGTTSTLPELAADLTEITLTPYVGPRAAALHAGRLRQQHVGRSQTQPFARPPGAL